jgi:sec-independent protein translocase protein TatA
MDFSLWQIAIVLVIALLVFGPKRLPDLGRSLGSGMKEFKDSITGDDQESQRAKNAREHDAQVDAEVVGETRA